MTNRSLYLILIATLMVGVPTGAQDTGGLPQAVQWGMQQAMRDLENQSLGITEEAMAEQVREEDLRNFLEGAVVRLMLSPDGEFAAYSLEGGELVEFQLGKQQVEIAGDWEQEESWLKRVGRFSPPKRPQKLSMKMSVREQEYSVECFNKYGQAEADVTYYVGPLNGLFCMGLADTETSGN